MHTSPMLNIILFFCLAFCLAENAKLSEQSNKSGHDPHLQSAYDHGHDDGYHLGYSHAMEDTESYESAVAVSDKLITDQVENPNLYQIDTDNPFK